MTDTGPCKKRGGCPGVRRCRGSCGHRLIVEDYYMARHSAWLALEAATKFDPEDVDRYVAANGPLITFKSFLIGRRRPDELRRAA